MWRRCQKGECAKTGSHPGPRQPVKLGILGTPDGIARRGCGVPPQAVLAASSPPVASAQSKGGRTGGCSYSFIQCELPCSALCAPALNPLLRQCRHTPAEAGAPYACHSLAHFCTRHLASASSSLPFGKSAMIATLTSKGQITVPLPVRETLGLKPGHQLDFKLLPSGRIELNPVGLTTLGDLKNLLPKAAVRLSLEEMDEAIATGIRAWPRVAAASRGKPWWAASRRQIRAHSNATGRATLASRHRPNPPPPQWPGRFPASRGNSTGWESRCIARA